MFVRDDKKTLIIVNLKVYLNGKVSCNIYCTVTFSVYSYFSPLDMFLTTRPTIKLNLMFFFFNENVYKNNCLI